MLALLGGAPATYNSNSCHNLRMEKGYSRSWPYFFVRCLFKFTLKIFYSTIVVENVDLISMNGAPCILCANHGNSLTDAAILTACVPHKKRRMLRLTAKSTQFGRRTFVSWLIESAGTVPIKRRKDHHGNPVDNYEALEKLMQAFDTGDAVCLFPEGGSRFHPAVAPLKTGVARLVSDALTRHRDNPDFEIYVQNCSFTYTHRQHWRSDVLLTFHSPMKFCVKDNPELLDPVEFSQIRFLTARIHQQISSGTLDSPSWHLIRTAKLAATMYAPLGTRMSLGDHVRLAKTFLEAFKAAQDARDGSPASDGRHTSEDSPENSEDAELRKLLADLKSYQDQLASWGLKDDRIRRPLHRWTMTFRLFMRLSWSLFLLAISIPGTMLWLPIVAVTSYAIHNFKKTGPIWDTWDEIAQYKIVYGFLSGLCVWFGATLLTLPIAPVTFFLIPALMWMTMRWFEDAISALRAFVVLVRLLFIGDEALRSMRERRMKLYRRLMDLAVNTLDLPVDPETYFLKHGTQEKGRVTSTWDSGARYFSVSRRRKRDWNEILRLYDKVDYPEVD